MSLTPSSRAFRKLFDGSACVRRSLVGAIAIVGSLVAAQTATAAGITSQPSNQTITIPPSGQPQSATFSVVASGSSVTYQWQASANGGASWSTLTDSSTYANT